MIIDSTKEACDVLEDVVNEIEDTWRKNQAIDALIFIKEELSKQREE